MKIRLKKLLNKHKNRIFSFIAVILCIPLFSVSSFAQSLTVDTTTFYLYQDELTIYSFDNGFDFNTGEFNLNAAKYYYSLNVSDEYVYKFGYNDITSGLVSYFLNPWDFPYLPDLYDYYFVCGQYSENNDFLADKIYLYVRENGVDVPLYAPSFDVDKINSSDKSGYTYTFKLEDFDYSSISALGLFDDSGSGIWPNLYTWYIVVPVLKGTSSEEIDSIISAINNQTDTLGGYIDKGNSSTSGIVSGNNSAIGELDEVVSEYHATEQQFFDDFNTNQQAITSDIVGWSWGGLVNCANWVGSTMTDYYNNMGDFRQYIIYPLMLGIVLFFLGRGGSIIGHLFRKPMETTVNTKSVFRREGNTRYTTTTTSRQGGVFRK